MGFGSKKFWRSVAELGLALAPGGGVAVAAAKAGAGLVLGELLKPDSDEQKRFQLWVEVAEALERNEHLSDDDKWTALVARVTEDLTEYYGSEPKIHDVMFNASAALKEARKEFEE